MFLSSRSVRCATLIAMLGLAGCPGAAPDGGKFASPTGATNDAGGGLDATSADEASADVPADAAGSDLAIVADIVALDADSTIVPDVPPTGDATVAKDTDSTCGCAVDADCAGVAVAVCQIAVCKSCACLVQTAVDGAGCGGDLTCQKGSCTPPAKPGPWASSIAAGGHHSCARHPDGSASCWGSGSQGQLGSGSSSDKVKKPQAVAGLLSISQLAAGNSHTCALHDGGKVSCWGDRFSGQTGSGDKDGEALVPESAGNFADALSIGVGTYGSFAVRNGATLWGWGKGNDGQMLMETLLSQPSPVHIEPLLNVKQVCAGEFHVCALHGDGKVECWGRNTDGQLGHSAASYDSPPLPPGPVAGLPAVVGLACGYKHSCAWNAAGKAWCWGSNMDGQIGTGSYTTQPLNAAVQLPDITDIMAMACGQGQTCVVRKTGAVLCWGDDEKGESGGNGSGDIYVPKVVDIGGKASAVAAGTDHSCALREDGAVACWGNNGYGQLGDGSTTQGYKVVLVVGSTPP